MMIPETYPKFVDLIFKLLHGGRLVGASGGLLILDDVAMGVKLRFGRCGSAARFGLLVGLLGHTLGLRIRYHGE
jgi:hypothetical protein